MKTLKFKFDLDSKVAIYVPSTINVSEETDNRKQVLNVIRRLSEMFGGATASDAVGGWVSQTGDVIVEKVKVVYSFCTTGQLKDRIDDILAICEDIKNEMKQEAVTLEINGQVKFV